VSIDIFAEAAKNTPQATRLDLADQILNGAKGAPQKVTPADAGFMTNMKVGFAVEPSSDISILAKKFFPNEDPKKAAGRFGIKDGNYIFVDDAGELKDASDSGGAARFLGEAGPGIGVGTVGALGGPVGAGIGAGAGELWRRNLSRLLFDEHKRSGLTDIGAGATEGVIDFAGGKLFTLAGKAIRGAKGLPIADEFDAKKIKQVQDEVFKKTGIQIDAAQASDDAALQQLRDWANRQPAKASSVIKTLGQMQNEQSEQSVRQLLEAIAGDVPEGAVVKGISGSSSAAIKTARNIVQTETRPFYEAAVDGAEASGIKVDVSPVLQQLDDLISGSKGGVRKALTGAQELFKVSDGGAWDTSMKGLQGTKIALDALINGKGTEETVDRVTRARLIEVKAALESQMEAASPMYKKANQMYAQMSQRLVNPLQDGLVGALADLEDQGLRGAAQTAARIVTDPSVPLTEVARTREAILKTRGGKSAWNGVSRMWLSGALERAAKETQGGDVVNFAGKFRQAVYATPKQRVLAKQMLGENSAQFEDLMGAFEMLAKTPIRGSNTQADQLITRNAGSSVAQGARFLRNVGGNVLDRMDDRAALKFANDIAEAMTNPEKLSQLKILRKLPVGVDRALLMTGVVTNNVALPGDTPPDQQVGAQ